MQRFIRILSSFAVAFSIAVTLAAVRCFAYDYSKISGTNASGASINNYKTAIQINVLDFGADSSGKKDSYTAIQNALNYAVDNASNKVQLKVIIPEGRYIIKKPLKIYSNTWLYMEGATIVRGYDKGYMLKNAMQNPKGGYSGDKNIIIEGGCFDGNVSYATFEFSMIRLAHLKNLWIKGVEFKNNVNGHHLEIGGAKNVTIEDCSFHGYYGSMEKEAIQLDTMNGPEVFQGFAPFDDTPCDNVVIKNNRFYDLMRGLGSHSATLGVYYTNILISGNTFENLQSTAMVMCNYKNCIIENNVMKNVGYGIDFKYMTLFENGNYHVPVDGYAGIKDRLDNNANTIIRNNTITTKVTPYIANPFGIQLYGRKLKGSENHPDYNYRVEGVKISGNTIKTVGKGIYLEDCSGILVQSNKVSFDGSGEYREVDLISLNECSSSAVKKNVCSGGKQNSVYICGGSGNTVSGNKFRSPGVSGVYLSGGAKKTAIKSNTVEIAGSNGIKITKKSEANVVKNTVKKSKNCGIVFSDSSGCAKSNTVKENKKGCILLESGSTAEVTDNTLSSDSSADLIIRENSKAYIKNNEFSGKSEKMAAGSGGKAVLFAAEDLKADKVYADHVQLSWKSVPGAEGYYVLRRHPNTDEEFHQVASVTATSHVDLGLAAKTKYEYKIVAYITVSGKVYDGRATSALNIKTKKSLDLSETDLPESVSYTGKAVKPDFNVYLGEEKLNPNVDYTVEYFDNNGVGTASVRIYGCGQYCGYKDFTFEIKFKGEDKKTEASAGLSQIGTSLEYKYSDVRLKIINQFAIANNVEAPEGFAGGQTYIQRSLDRLEKQKPIRFEVRNVTKTPTDTIYGLWR